MAALALSITAPAHAGRGHEVDSCLFDDLKADVHLSGRCELEVTEINGHFGYKVTWPSGRSVTVEYVKQQSGRHLWRLNGEAAAAVEVNREHLVGFTLDLNQFLEWEEHVQRR